MVSLLLHQLLLLEQLLLQQANVPLHHGDPALLRLQQSRPSLRHVIASMARVLDETLELVLPQHRFLFVCVWGLFVRILRGSV